MLNVMSAEPEHGLQPPTLPHTLTAVWPVIAVGMAAWLIAGVAAFTVPVLDSWRPFTLAGLGVGLLGTAIFLRQRDDARRGVRGAQTGLETAASPANKSR